MPNILGGPESDDAGSLFESISSQDYLRQDNDIGTAAPLWRAAHSRPLNPVLSDEDIYVTTPDSGYQHQSPGLRQSDYEHMQSLGLMSAGTRRPTEVAESASILTGVKAGFSGYFSGAIKSLGELGVVDPLTASRGVRKLDNYRMRVAGREEEYYSQFQSKEWKNFAKHHLGSGIGQMMPVIALAAAGGGVGGALGLTAKGVGATVTIAQRAGTFLHIFGSEVEDMRRAIGDEVSEEAKWGAALVSTLAQTWIESSFGGERFARSIGKMAAGKAIVGQLDDSVLAKIGRSFMSRLGVSMVKNGLGSGMEEIGERWVSDLTKKALDRKHRMTPLGDLLTSEFAAAIPAGALFGGFDAMVDQHKTNIPRAVKEMLKDPAKTQAVLDRLTPDERLSFGVQMDRISKVATAGMSKEEAAAGMDMISRTCLAFAMQTGSPPAAFAETFNVAFANRNFTMAEFAKYASMPESEQLRWITESGVLDEANLKIEEARVEQMEDMAKAQAEQIDKKTGEGKQGVQLAFEAVMGEATEEAQNALPADVPDGWIEVKPGMVAPPIGATVINDEGLLETIDSPKQQQQYAKPGDSQITITDGKPEGLPKSWDQVGDSDVWGPKIGTYAWGADGKPVQIKTEQDRIKHGKVIPQPVKVTTRPIFLADGTPFTPGTWIPVDALPTAWFRHLYVEQGLRGVNAGQWYDSRSNRVFIPDSLESISDIVAVAPNTSEASQVVTPATESDLNNLLRRRAQATLSMSNNELRAKLNEEVDEVLSRLTLPLYQKNSILPVAQQIAKGAKSVVLAHWSPTSAIKSVDASHEGEGQQGAESKRKAKYPELWVKRSHWGGPQCKEDGIQNMPYRYKASIPASKLYNMTEDKDGLILVAKSKSEWGDQEEMVSIYEGLVKEAGYAGFYFEGDDSDVVQMFDSVKVEPVAKGRSLFQRDTLRDRALGIDAFSDTGREGDGVQDGGAVAPQLEQGTLFQQNADPEQIAASLPEEGDFFTELLDALRGGSVNRTAIATAYGLRIKGNEKAISNLQTQRAAKHAEFTRAHDAYASAHLEAGTRDSAAFSAIQDIATAGQLYREALEDAGAEPQALAQGNRDIDAEMQAFLDLEPPVEQSPEGATPPPPSSMVNESPIAGQYFKSQQLAVFFSTASADTLMHEFMHHLRTNRLLLPSMEQTLLEASGETEWTVKAEEFVADSILAYFRDGTLPEGVSGEWLAAVNNIRDVFGKYSAKLRADGWALTPEVDELFSGLFQKSEGVAAQDTNQLIADAVDASMRNSESLYSGSKSKVGKINMRRFHVARKIYTEKTGKDSRELLDQAGAKSYIYAKDDPTGRQEGDMTSEDMKESLKILEEQPEVVLRNVERIEQEIKAKKAEVQRLKALAPDDLALEVAARKAQAEHEAEELVTASKAMPVSEEMRLRTQGGALWKQRMFKGYRGASNLTTNPENMFKMLDGGNEDGQFTNAFWERMWGATRQHASRFIAATKFISDTAKSLGGIPDNLMHVERVNDNGTDKQYTLSKLVGIYMHTEGGDLKSKTTKVLMRNNQDVTENVIKFARKRVEDDAKAMAYVRTIQAYMGRVWPELAATSKVVLGREIGDLGRFYLPLVYEDKNIAETGGLDILEGLDVKGTDVRGLSRTPSQVKRREGVRGGRLELDSLKLFLRYMESSENYIAKAQPVQQMLWMLKYPKLAEQITMRYGGGTLDALKEMVSREMSPTGRVGSMGPGEASMQRLRSGAVQSFLGLNPFTMLKQPVSMLNAMSEIDVMSGLGNFTKTFLGTIGKIGKWDIESNEDYQRMIEESPVMKIRAQFGQVDPEFDNLVNQKYASTPVAKAAQSKNPIARAMGHGLNGVRLFDMITVTAVFTTARNSALSEGKTLEEAIAYAEKIVRKTQPPTSISERSLMQTSNEYVKSAILFTGQLFKNMNYYVNDIVMPMIHAYEVNGTPGAMKEAWNLRRKVLFAVALPSIAMGMIARRRPQANSKELWLDLLAYPLAAFPLVGSGISSGIRGFGSDAYSAIWNDVVTSINKVVVDHARGNKSFGNPEDIWDDAKQLERMAFTLWGIPQYPARVLTTLMEQMVESGTAKDFPELMVMARKNLGFEPKPEQE